MKVIRITSGNLPTGRHRLATPRLPFRWRRVRLSKIPHGMAVCAAPFVGERLVVLAADADARGWAVAGYGWADVPEVFEEAGEPWLREKL
jgi:hypothetical protein